MKKWANTTQICGQCGMQNGKHRAVCTFGRSSESTPAGAHLRRLIFGEEE